MKNITDLLTLLQVTRSQVQQGYILSNVKKNDLSNLAEHHYLVTMYALVLGKSIAASGGKIDLQKVLEFSLFHDVGEIFGGDISMPYARKNPKAREYAKKYERENQNFITQYFPDPSEYQAIMNECLDVNTDEAKVSKIADYIETAHYLHYFGYETEFTRIVTAENMKRVVESIGDEKTKDFCQSFIDDWEQNYGEKNIFELLES